MPYTESTYDFLSLVYIKIENRIFEFLFSAIYIKKHPHLSPLLLQREGWMRVLLMINAVLRSQSLVLVDCFESSDQLFFSNHHFHAVNFYSIRLNQNA